MNVLYFTNIPSPYTVDFCNELSKYCSLTVIYERSRAGDREEDWYNNVDKYYTEFILEQHVFGLESSIGIKWHKIVKQNSWDIICVDGYASPSAILLVLYCQLKKLKYCIRSDGTFMHKSNYIVEVIKKVLFKKAKACFVSSTQTAQYFQMLGVLEKNIFKYPFSSIRKSDIVKVSEIEKQNLKHKLHIDSTKLVISVGQFIPRKGFDVLIKACKYIGDDVCVLIIGGNVNDEYLKLCNENNVHNIKFMPFMKKDELKKYYLASDIFAFPTREDIWGLVINEALAAGLPVVSTNRCMAALEMVQDGENGFIVDVENEEQLADKINEILNDSELRKKMSENSLKMAEKYTIDETAQVFADVFNRLMRN